MRKNIHDGKTKRFFASPWFYVAMALALALVGFAYGRSYYQAYKVKKEIESLQEQVRKLEKKRLESMKILSYVMSNDFVEEKARVELNLKKPGEHVIVMPDEETAPNAPVRQPAEDLSGQTEANPIKWWKYFFGSR